MEANFIVLFFFIDYHIWLLLYIMFLDTCLKLYFLRARNLSYTFLFLHMAEINANWVVADINACLFSNVTYEIFKQKKR